MGGMGSWPEKAATSSTSPYGMVGAAAPKASGPCSMLGAAAPQAFDPCWGSEKAPVPEPRGLPPSITALTSKSAGAPPPATRDSGDRLPTSQAKALASSQAKAKAAPKAPAPADNTKATAIALIQGEDGPQIKKDPQEVQELLEKDWEWFIQLRGANATDADSSNQGGGVVIGEDVHQAVKAGSVSVLFCPHAAGPKGEALAMEVLDGGGRGFLVGATNALAAQIDNLSAVLKSARPFQSAQAAKRQRLQEPQDQGKALRQALKDLGRIENLQDKESVPKLAAEIAENFLTELGATTTFEATKSAYLKVKGQGHRKALVYVVHELLRKKGKALAAEDRRPMCMHFLVGIGDQIRCFTADERQAYIRLVAEWEKRKYLTTEEMQKLKESWDID